MTTIDETESMTKFRLPDEMKRETGQTVSVRLPAQIKERIEQIADKHGLSFSRLLAEILADYIKYYDSLRK